MKIVIIGAGNLATHTAKALRKAGEEIIMIYSQTTESACALGEALDVPYTNNILSVPVDADLYLFAIKDSALESILKQITPNNGIWAHTAGSIDINIFNPYTSRAAVFYPLQTFSKSKDVDFTNIPVCIEAVNKEDEVILYDLAKKISSDVQLVSSEQRKYLHLAAVFACNFTNHMYDIASEILETNGLSFDIIKPLLKETYDKILTLSPSQAQTGPAVRYDENIINNQFQLIKDKDVKDIYLSLSRNIYKYSKKK